MSMQYVPKDLKKSWQLDHGIIFQRTDNTFWKHGRIYQRDKWVLKSEPIKLECMDNTCEITNYNSMYIIFKKDNKYYAYGDIPFGTKESVNDNYYDLSEGPFHKRKIERIPLEIPIKDIKKVFAYPSNMYVCTETECYVVGHNNDIMLGLNKEEDEKEEEDTKYSFKLVDWYPIAFIYDDYQTLQIKMKDNKWYGLGWANDIDCMSLSSFVNPPFTEEEKCFGDRVKIPYPLEFDSETCIMYDEWYIERELRESSKKINDDICKGCNYDKIDINYNYRSYCTDCLYQMGKFKEGSKAEMMAKLNLYKYNRHNLVKLQTLLVDEFAPLLEELKDFKGFLTDVVPPDFINSVKFENRLLAKRFIHDKLWQYQNMYYWDGLLVDS